VRLCKVKHVAAPLEAIGLKRTLKLCLDPDVALTLESID
jgi:hypothetical protein